MNTVDETKLAALKRQLAVGINDLDHGRFQSYNADNLMLLADDVGRTGRIHMDGLRLKAAAKVNGRKK